MSPRRIRKPRPLAACVIATLVVLYPVSSPLAASGAARAAAPKPRPVPGYAGVVEIGRKGELLKNAASCDMYQNSATGGANADKRSVLLKGNEARRFLAAQAAATQATRDLKAHAISALTKKGFRPTDDVNVVLFQSKAGETPTAPSLVKRITNFFFPTLNAQQEAVYYNEGVMWFNSWDDGDSSTWEGQLGALDYATGNYADGGVQIRVNNIDNERASVDYRWNDGGVLVPSWYLTSAQAYASVGQAAVGCIGACLGTALMWCAFSGPGTLACVGTRCTAGWGVCMVGAMWAHYMNRIYRPTCIWVNGTQYCS